MIQTVFFRCMVFEEKCIALRTLGCTEGGIGIIKETKERGWVATHIPTGAKITPYTSKHKTARQAMLEAEDIIAKSKDILACIQKVRSTKGYEAFLEDRYKQLREEVD